MRNQIGSLLLYIFSSDPNLYYLLGGLALTSILFYFLLTRVQKMPGPVRKLLYVPAPKSHTNAMQVGGLPFGLLIIGTFLFMAQSEAFRSKFFLYEKNMLYHWCLSAFFIMIYGYLDDRYEIRPIVKLLSQILVAFYFSFATSMNVFSNNSALYFVAMFFLSLAVLNGTNLLDGIDGLSYKVAIGTYIHFFILSAAYYRPPVALLAAVCIAALAGFYYYNSPPSKIHLGEVGSTMIGHSYLLLFAILLKSYFVNRTVNYNIQFFDCFKLVIPLTLPFIEVGISFCRRIYNKKSPFRGDKLHLHYILRYKKKMSVGRTGNFIGLLHFFSAGVALHLSLYYNSMIVWAGLVVFLVAVYIAIGAKYWVGKDTLEFTFKAFGQALLKKEVDIVETSLVDDLTVEVIREDKSTKKNTKTKAS
jgi:UDP-GlcNAc:undecaprenyl-phosphate GlcNAc-1-phosphate transferase